MKEIEQRAGSPVSAALDIIGDRWSLVIIWDMIMNDRNTYNELLKSNPGIATNVLASRLARLEAAGILTKADHPDSKAKILYRLTHKGIDLLPALVELMLWAHAYLPVQSAGDAYIKLLKQNKDAFVKRIVADMKEKMM
nr:helix-turn-helix domain-containing protein [uncultured Mucilaginibacter sp.]